MEFNIYSIVIILEIIIFSCGINACDETNCRASNGAPCNDQGFCDCGTCICEDSYSGPTCEECLTCPSPCEVFKGCVGCKIFGTGKMNIMDCILLCDDIANYIPVDKLEFDSTSDNRTFCQTLNSKYCMESFRIGDMSYGYRDLYVRTEEDCAEEYLPTNPPVLEVTLDMKEKTEAPIYDPEVDVSDEKDDDSEGSVEVVAVSGSRQGNDYDGNSANIGRTLSIYCVLIMALSFLLS